MTLTSKEKMRYLRQTVLPSIGIAGQEKLQNAKVLVIGVGGLGCPSALYLAAAGVGTLGLVDFDVVSLSNLQRQILYGEATLGASKIKTAQTRLQDTNPNVNLILHEEKLTAENTAAILKNYDVILNGADNFATRYLVNDACVLLKKPLIDAAILRFEGRLTVFDSANGTPCYRCIYPEAPPPHETPNCQEAGVFGALPGIIGSMQAMEALKIILGIGEILVGRLLIYDALAQKFREMKITRNKECAVCGAKPEIHFYP